MVTYSAKLDVPRELVLFLSKLLAGERRRKGTRKGRRALTTFWQAVLVLRWFRDRTDTTKLARDHGVARATGYRYVDEGIEALAAQAPDLHDALQRAKDNGDAYLILDGKNFSSDRLGEKTTSTKGTEIDLWYSGKTREQAGNIQALTDPDGFPLWVSDVEPGSVHDITAAETTSSAPCTGLTPSSTCPPWPTAATRVPEPGSSPRSNTPKPAKAAHSTSTTRPTTNCCAACAPSANADSPCSPAVGAPYDTSPPAPAKSAPSSKPHSYSPNSNTADSHNPLLRSPH